MGHPISSMVSVLAVAPPVEVVGDTVDVVEVVGKPDAEFVVEVVGEVEELVLVVGEEVVLVASARYAAAPAMTRIITMITTTIIREIASSPERLLNSNSRAPPDNI